MHLYILQSEDGPVKIGITGDPHKRIGAIRTASGREFCRVYVSPAIEAAAAIEVRLFQRFRDRRLPGEWFSIEFREALDAADEIGLQVAGRDWVDAERYIRGRAANLRLSAFMARGPSAQEIAAFSDGFAGLEDDARYAALCDGAEVGAGLVSLTPTEPLRVRREVAEEFLRKLQAIRDELIVPKSGSDSTI